MVFKVTLKQSEQCKFEILINDSSVFKISINAHFTTIDAIKVT